MSKITRRSFVASTAAAGASFGLGAGVVRAQDYPNRTIRFIVPLAPGGAIDFVARQVGDVLTRSFGQQVVVENRTGAGGTVGMDAALKEPARRLYGADHQRQCGECAAHHALELRLH